MLLRATGVNFFSTEVARVLFLDFASGFIFPVVGSGLNNSVSASAASSHTVSMDEFMGVGTIKIFRLEHCRKSSRQFRWKR